ncbi:MAG: lipoyl(octanoyl) transferase LipB [Chloroflexota bacterium]
MTDAAPACEVHWLGTVDYQAAWDLQVVLVRARRAGEIPDQLLLLEHPHTYTLGRGAEAAHILLDRTRLRGLGVAVYETDRGGDVTYHGPGQLVGYPIVNLRRGDQSVDAHRYLRNLEETLIATLADFGVAAGRCPGYTGVWLGNEKIAAIGVKIAGGVTSHGFALNVNADLSYFRYIVPCGISDKGVTSLDRVLGRAVAMAEVVAVVAGRFAEVFACRMKTITESPYSTLTLGGTK